MFLNPNFLAALQFETKSPKPHAPSRSIATIGPAQSPVLNPQHPDSHAPSLEHLSVMNVFLTLTLVECPVDASGNNATTTTKNNQENFILLLYYTKKNDFFTLQLGKKYMVDKKLPNVQNTRAIIIVDHNYHHHHYYADEEVVCATDETWSDDTIKLVSGIIYSVITVAVPLIISAVSSQSSFRRPKKAGKEGRKPPSKYKQLPKN